MRDGTVERFPGRAAEDEVEGVEGAAEVQPLRPVDDVQLEEHRRRWTCRRNELVGDYRVVV